jgi:hypothetical protein
VRGARRRKDLEMAKKAAKPAKPMKDLKTRSTTDTKVKGGRSDQKIP